MSKTKAQNKNYLSSEEKKQPQMSKVKHFKEPDYDSYDKIIVSLSGGKDSIACLLYLLKKNVNKNKIELWHQCVDGKGDQKIEFFDWKSTEGYVREISKAFDIKLCWQWRDGGMWKEMHRENAPTGDVFYEYEGSEVNRLPKGSGNLGTRRKFPAKSADLSRRWCSGYLKIDVSRRCISHIFGTDPDNPPKILFISGERREESPNRAKYPRFESHARDCKSRVVDHFRPIIDFEEKKVWDLLKEYGVVPHPAYYLGFPRLSCMCCIFFTKDHWATLNEVNPAAINIIDKVEKKLDFTLDNNKDIRKIVNSGNSKLEEGDEKWVEMAITEFEGDILIDPEKWQLPKGAFTGGVGCGGSI